MSLLYFYTIYGYQETLSCIFTLVKPSFFDDENPLKLKFLAILAAIGRKRRTSFRRSCYDYTLIRRRPRIGRRASS